MNYAQKLERIIISQDLEMQEMKSKIEDLEDEIEYLKDQINIISKEEEEDWEEF